MPRPRWSEPTLFDPEQIRYRRLSMRIDCHLDGPAGSIETWSTVTDESGGWVHCTGGDHGLLVPHGRAITTELAGSLFDWSMRRLEPF
jgi:hypothetical protein